MWVHVVVSLTASVYLLSSVLAPSGPLGIQAGVEASSLVSEASDGSRLRCKGVRLSKDVDIQEAINARSPGTTFCLRSGTYSIDSPLHPKSNQRFISIVPRGAVLTGKDSTSMAFNGQGATGVEVRGLVITRFAPPDRGGFAALKASRGWRIINSEIAHNENAGLYHEANSTIRRNYIHHNTKVGFGGFKAHNSVVVGNEVAFNGSRGGPDNGASKWVGSVNLTIRRNYVHHNFNNGIWVNGDNDNVLIEHNVIALNYNKALHYEINCTGSIRYNKIRNNGDEGILIVASQDVNVHNNLVKNNGKGILVSHQDLGMGSNCPWTLKNVRLHRNTVYMDKGFTGLQVWNANDGDQIFAPGDRRVRFYDNSYYLKGTAQYFHWMNNLRSVPEWKSYGQDVNGTFRQQ